MVLDTEISINESAILCFISKLYNSLPYNGFLNFLYRKTMSKPTWFWTQGLQIKSWCFNQLGFAVRHQEYEEHKDKTI